MSVFVFLELEGFVCFTHYHLKKLSHVRNLKKQRCSAWEVHVGRDW